MNRILRRHGSLTAVAAMFAFAALCQETAPPERFDVAAITPADPNTYGGFVQFPPGGRFSVKTAQLIFIIQNVYGLRDYQIVDAPKWIVDWGTSRFSIEAKASGPRTTEQLKLMAQALLADRFQLKVHYETRDLPVYALIPGKNGPKLTASKDDGRPRGSGGIASMAPGWIQGKNILMSYLILDLTRQAGRPVVDETGFTEAFDFVLKWLPEAGAGKTPEAAGPEVGLSLADAVQEQLGLKLEPRKAPTKVLVIDHVERPSAN